MDRVAGWLLIDLLKAYVRRMQNDALERHRWDVLTWAVLAPYQKKPSKPPPVPSILKRG